MKNCELLVCGPALAIDTMPRLLYERKREKMQVRKKEEGT
jgi:hypothetical protein